MAEVDGLRRLFWLIPLALLPVPLWLNPYQQYVLNTALVYVPVGIGFNLVVGNLGSAGVFQCRLFRPRRLHQRHPDGIAWPAVVADRSFRRQSSAASRLRRQHPRAAWRAPVLSRHHDARVRRADALDLYKMGSR